MCCLSPCVALGVLYFTQFLIGPLHDPVTWYGINYTGTQITQWDFQNKGKSGWTGVSSFVLEVPLRHLRPSVIYSVPCDRIVQRAYYNFLCTKSIFNSIKIILMVVLDHDTRWSLLALRSADIRTLLNSINCNK